MKLNRIAWITRDEAESLATFGDARLVKKLDGKTELRGGTPDEFFVHNARVPPPRDHLRLP